MTIKEEIFINQIVQDVVCVEKGREWFNCFNENEQLNILSFVSRMSIEARVKAEDVDVAITNSKLKLTFTPCVLLKKGRIDMQLGKVLSLPSEEYNKAFLLLINLLKLADARRRELICKGECSHWWHEDLSDEKVVSKILKEHKSFGFSKLKSYLFQKTRNGN